VTPTFRTLSSSTGSPAPSPGQSAQSPSPSSPSSPSAPTAEAVELELVAEGFDAPLYVTAAGDGSGRLYLVEQGGRIRVVGSNGDVVAEPFLDISALVSAGGERGLLGLAFHPDFDGTGERRFFVNYTDRNGDTVVAAYETEGGADPGARAEAGSERVILQIDQPAANHNGGWLGFGPDGFLYIATGDGGGGASENGQRLDTLLGKLLRIDIDGGDPYAIPGDNPFAAGTRGERPEIWLYGLRNPWRLSFDRETGDLFIGDVGAGRREELDYLPAGTAGANLGWPRMEGFECLEGECGDEFTRPIHDYARNEGQVITGGYVYRGSSQPALRGAYVFGDYATGRLWSFPVTEAAPGAILDTPPVVAETRMAVSSFGEDEAGELYLTDIAGGGLYRIVAVEP
jgi:glucose/arabinose dehydrogenase